MKQLIIIVCYIPLGLQSQVKARTRMQEFRELMSATFTQDLQDETSTIIRTIVLPCAHEQESKIECIYPTVITSNVVELLEKIMVKQYTLNLSNL